MQDAVPDAVPDAGGRRAVDVEFRAVTKRFGGTTAVDAVSLQVREGEFLALLGPSGCGKTTCLRMIAGLETPDSGTLLVAGEDMAGVPPGKRPVNTVFQSYALFGHMSVLDNVAFGLKQRGVRRTERAARAREALEMVRLADRAGHRPRQLSGGQQQRVALARALVLRPRVLLLDEPLSALDLQLRKEMQGELRRLHRELGITFVFVTHDQSEAMAMADRIAVMDGGRIEQLAAPEEVYERPATPFVASFIGEMNQFSGPVSGPAGDRAVSTGLGSVRLPGGSHDDRHGDVRVGIRPESLVLAPAGEGTPGAPAAPATVVETGLIGEMTRVVVRLPGGGDVVVRRPRSEWPWLRTLAAGDAVEVTWSPADVVVLAEAGRP